MSALTANGAESPAPSTRDLWVAYVAGAFGLAINAMGGFLVPLRARELGASFDIIGIIVAAGAIVPALLSVPLGTVIARLGSRRAFIAGTFGVGATSVAFIGVTSYWWLLPLQLVLGTVRMLGWIGSQSHVTNIGPAAQRSARTGRWSFFSNLGPMVSTLLIGLTAQLLGFRLAFGFIAAYAFAFCLVGFLMRELHDRQEAEPGRKRSTGFREALPMLRVPGVQTALSLTFVRILVERLWSSFMPVLLVGAGLTPALASTVVFCKSAVSTVTAPTVGRLTRLASPANVLIVGLGAGLVGLAASPLMLSVPATYLPAVLVGISHGLSLPLLLTLVADAIPEQQRPVALGLRGSVNQMASTGAPGVGGALIAAFGAALAFGAIASVGLALLALALFSSRRIVVAPADPEGPAAPP